MADDIGDVIRREGGFVNDPQDHGGRTAFGISEKSNPEAFRNGPPTAEEARVIYEQKYVKGPGFDRITDPALRSQLIDYGVNSGPGVAVSKLQKVLGVPVDGVLGPATLAALEGRQGVNNRVVAERVKMIGAIVQKNPSQLKFLSGWLNRALEFQT